MVRTLLLVFGALGLAACQGARIPLAADAGVADGAVVESGVVSVYSWREDGVHRSRMQGTGFFISPEIVVTNYHVIEGADEATIRFADGVDRRVTAIVGDDPNVDLVLLRVETGDDVSPLVLATHVPEPGTAVRAIGSPDGHAQSVVETQVGSHVVAFDVLDEALMITTSIRPGMSGAPVLDLEGRVVGVLSRGTNVERQSYMVPASRVEAIQRFERPLPVGAWDRWRRRAPGNVGRARFGEAAVAFERGAFARSIRLLREAVDAGLSEAGQATAWYVIGDALSNLGRDVDAVAAYHRSIDLKPRHALSHAALGSAFRRQHRIDEAIQSYKTARDLMPLSASFNVGLGWSWIEKGEAGPAYTSFRRAIQIEPDEASAWTGVATACLELGRTEEARKYARHATALRPDAPQSFWVLGSAYTRLGAWDDAIAALEHGLALEPGHPRALFELGRAHLRLGHARKASEQRRLLEARDPQLSAQLALMIGQI